MEKRRLEILKAPTGWGKSYRLRQMAKEAPILLAVPTHTIAKEQLEKARGEGIDAMYVRGRRRFICGKKLALLSEEERKEVAKWIQEDGSLKEKAPPEVVLKVGQDYLCCRRANCEHDPFAKQFTENFPPLVITTHAFLSVAPFVGDKNYVPSERILAIDEADVFLTELQRPKTLVSSLSLSELEGILKEIARDLKIEIKAQIKAISKHFPSGSGAVFINTGKGLEKGKGYSSEVIRKTKKVIALLEEVKGKIERKPHTGGYREAINSALELFKRILLPQEEGEYSWVGDKKIGVSMVLFSPSAWLKLNSIVSVCNPQKVILASATFPRSLLSFFPSHRWEITHTGAKECETPFPESELYVAVGYREYDHENREEYVKYAANVIERFGKGHAVVLLSSFRDIELLREKLEEKGVKVIAQSEENEAQEVVERWKEEGGILLGNLSFWRGLNITETDRFFIYKLPFESPETPHAEALQAYQRTKHFAVARENAKNLFAQGAGRVIRENGVRKFLFVLDARIRHYGDFLDVFKESPCRVYFLELRERDVKEV